MLGRKGLLVAAVTTAVIANAGAQASTPLATACTATGLRAAFRGVAGSAGAGQISYTVRLTNRSEQPCTLSGRPALRLLDRHGHALPTTVVPDHLATATAVLVTLSPGNTAIAIARFSPDIPGTGEPQRGRCEPLAYRLRVTVGSGHLTGPVTPPTSVCEHGRIVEGLLHRATP